MAVAAFFLLLFSCTPFHFRCTSSSGGAVRNRRVLHQPFFPLTSAALPPAQPPSPSFPKYPSSSSSPSFHPRFRPFFPLNPPPPPPPVPSRVTALPTFPANISTLTSSTSRRSPSRLLPAVATPLLAVALLVLSLVLFLHLHRCRGAAGKDGRSDNLCLFPPDSAASDGQKLSAAASSAAASAAPADSEFVYLGTVVSSRGRAGESSAASHAARSGSANRNLGSPELRPLPPLPRQVQSREVRRSSSSEEFYSPKNSPGAKRNTTALASNSKKPAFGDETKRCGSRSSTLSTPSYLSSNVASSPSPSSPITSSPPPPPRPPQLLRPPTPSPPKRRPRSHSPPSSPLEVDCSGKLEISQYSGQNLQSPRKIGEFARSSVTLDLNHPPPPPPPPPQPPAGYPEGQHVKMPSFQPPPLLPPRSNVVWSSSIAQECSDAAEKHDEKPRPKLKPLHWDKVRASSDRAMVWDQLKSGSFQLNEEMIETLFGTNSTMPPKEMIGGHLNPSSNMESSRILDPKKSQNIAILLKALNVTTEEVCAALLEGNADILGSEILEALTKMVPSKEEELQLKGYKDDSPFKLGPAEAFLKAVLDIPFAFKRVDALLYIANFNSEVSHLRSLFWTIQSACEELRSSRMLHRLLEAVLKTGNRMNVGTNRGEARAFKLDALLKLVDVKGVDGKTTLLHFVVQEISRAEGMRTVSDNPSAKGIQSSSAADLEYCKHGIQVVSNLGAELGSVKKAAAMDSDVLSSNVGKIGGGICQVREVMQLSKSIVSEDGRRFHAAVDRFVGKAEDEISSIQAQESFALSDVREITEYFHGDSAKEEAHPFRIFMVVRDFLSILEQVCREVENINERNIVIMARQLPVTGNQASNAAAFPSGHRPRPAFSDDESSSSS